VSIASGQSSDYTCPGDRGVDDGDDIGELGLEDGVKIGGRCERCQAVARWSGTTRMRGPESDVRVGEFGKNADIGRVFKLCSFDRQNEDMG
jgi:hypothetical protein